MLESIKGKSEKVKSLTDIASACEIENTQLDEKGKYRLSNIIRQYYPLEVYK